MRDEVQENSKRKVGSRCGPRRGEITKHRLFCQRTQIQAGKRNSLLSEINNWCKKDQMPDPKLGIPNVQLTVKNGRFLPKL